MNILFIAMNNMGNEFTGGDRIWIELAKRWYPNKADIDVLMSDEAGILLGGIHSKKRVSPTILNIVWNTITKLIDGIRCLPRVRYDYVYSVSDFYPDLIPALTYKLRHSSCKWIAGYYLVAPPPFAHNSPYKGLNRVKGLLYWLMQRLSLWLVRRYADIVYVTSEPDRKHFPSKKVVVIRGGVLKVGKRNDNPSYDGIFIGRFHYQKGVIELIDIWKFVCEEKSDARLLMIGDGPLMKQVKEKIVKYGLQDNVVLTGYVNGEDKYAFIQDSKIALHPSTFDSGGMACAESMAFGLPAVGWDLEAFKTYYPKGMCKAKSEKDFALIIIGLLKNKNFYNFCSNHAKELILKDWLWEKRAEDIWKETFQE